MKTHWRILVVDDEAVMCESLAAWLREDGYPVDTASSGRQASAGKMLGRKPDRCSTSAKRSARSAGSSSRGGTGKRLRGIDVTVPQCPQPVAIATRPATPTR